MLLGVWQLAVAVGALFAVVVSERIDRIDVTFPDDGPGDTWVIVGVDRRSHDVPDAVLATTGAPQDYPGSRADIILVVHRDRSGTRALSIPRDVFVRTEEGWLGRLALSVQAGHQTLVDALCQSLGVAADHLVVVDMSGFLALADVVGPIEVTIEAPIVDRDSGLHLATPGLHRLDAATALALVRSRHPMELVDDEWTAIPDGELRRAGWANVVFDQMLSSLETHRWNPLVMTRAAWVGSRSLELDASTSPLELRALLGGVDAVSTLPTDSLDDTIVRVPTDDAAEHLATVGAGTPCEAG